MRGNRATSSGSAPLGTAIGAGSAMGSSGRFGRLMHFQRIAARDDKLPKDFLAGGVLAAALIWWT
jgi:hypothetical protein